MLFLTVSDVLSPFARQVYVTVENNMTAKNRVALLPKGWRPKGIC